MNEAPQHAKFQDRFFASLLDTLIIGGGSFAINSLNIAALKSFWIYLLIAGLTILYKPYLESRYNATFGKMALNLKVTDWNYNNIDLNKSFLRSLIIIVPALFYIPLHYFAFNNEYVITSNSVFEFTNKMTEAYPTFTFFITFLSYATLADVIVYLVDLNKKQRSLKDYIAKTYVIKKEE